MALAFSAVCSGAKCSISMALCLTLCQIRRRDERLMQLLLSKDKIYPHIPKSRIGSAFSTEPCNTCVLVQVAILDTDKVQRMVPGQQIRGQLCHCHSLLQIMWACLSSWSWKEALGKASALWGAAPSPSSSAVRCWSIINPDKEQIVSFINLLSPNLCCALILLSVCNKPHPLGVFCCGVYMVCSPGAGA